MMFSRRPTFRAPQLDLLREYGIVASFIALFLILTLSNRAFFTLVNLTNILDQWAPAMIIALGQTFVIVAGGLDLSVGSMFAVSAVVSALATNATGSVGLGIVTGIVTAGLFGVINGLLVTVGRINSFIATLATTMLYSGVALSLTGGVIVTVADEQFRVLGNGRLFGIKLTVWIMVIAVIVAAVLLSRTNYGKWILAVGGNAEAARLSGIRVKLMTISTFMVSGLCSGIAGVMSASRIGSGQADTGATLALTAIAAVVLGGTSILGGQGAIWRTVLGVLLLALIANGFNLLGVGTLFQQMVTGAIILVAVGVDSWVRRSS